MSYTYQYTTADQAVQAAYDMEAAVADDLGISVDEVDCGVFYDCVRSVAFDTDPAVRDELGRRTGLILEG